MSKKYILTLNNIDEDNKAFIIRQIKRMPDYYRLGLNIICFVFYFLKLPPNKLKLFNKLISSLTLVKTNEQCQ